MDGRVLSNVLPSEVEIQLVTSLLHVSNARFPLIDLR